MFSSLIVWGSKLLPSHVLFDLEHVRDWANREGLIFDEDQCVTQDTVRELSRFFTRDDRLSILIELSSAHSGGLLYVEYPYVPVSTLIKQDTHVKLIYYRIATSELHFGFWIENSILEFASGSTGQIVLQRFREVVPEHSNTYTARTIEEEGQDTATEISDIDGAVKARFLRSGRAYDVRFTVVPS